MAGFGGFLVLGGVVWLLCAYLAYTTAAQKHRRPLTWGILGIFFGPLAFAAVFMMPPGNVPSHKHEAAADHDHGTGSHSHPEGSSDQHSSGHTPSHGQTQAQADNYEVPKHKH